MKTFDILFEDANGRKVVRHFTAPNLEDATIEGCNYAEEFGLEMVQVDDQEDVF